MFSTGIYTAVVISIFDDKLGPTPYVYFPEDIEKSALAKVADITIDQYLSEKVFPKYLLLVPFPMIGKNGLVRVFAWEDTNKRGEIALASLTILFHEKDDSIFYKYSKDFEIIFENSIKKFIDLIGSHSAIDLVENELIIFHQSIKKLLHQLSEQEFNSPSSSTEFPSIEPERKKASYSMKIIVVGDSYVGKTSTILKYTNRAFRRSYIPTIGVNFTEKWIELQNQNVQLLLWDIAGQSKFNTLRKTFYQGALGAILVFDVTSRKSFENIEKWYHDILENLTESKSIKMIICGNKKDLSDQIQVHDEEAMNLAHRLNMDFFKTSALTGENIEIAIQTLVQKIMKLRK